MFSVLGDFGMFVFIVAFLGVAGKSDVCGLFGRHLVCCFGFAWTIRMARMGFGSCHGVQMF